MQTNVAANVKSYLTVTGSYWAFTVTDGALRMLVVLYFHTLGYSPFEVALLFLLYEFCGVVTNLVGGWLATRLGLNTTLYAGMVLQIGALALLTVPDTWLSVIYVMFVQALSGVAKDLNKMSAKSSVKVLAGGGEDENSRLFRWVAALTGSKNALKGAGFFVGAALLQTLGFRGALAVLVGLLVGVLFASIILLPRELGRSDLKPKFTQVFSQSPAINWLAAGRFFLFGSRDAWFVVGLPVFLVTVLNWTFSQVGAFMALWVIGYGAVQAFAPQIVARRRPPTGATAMLWIAVLTFVPFAIVALLSAGVDPAVTVVAGLFVFGVLFAVNSSIHSYLILAYAEGDSVAMNVGFYYMANAGGRLLGTLVSGLAYELGGLQACLFFAGGFLLVSTVLSAGLPKKSDLQSAA